MIDRPTLAGPDRRLDDRAGRPLARALHGPGRAWARVAGAVPLPARLVGLILLACPQAGAQMPGVPVLQNGFVRPGAAAALNYGTAEGGDVVAVAGAWTPASSRFQLTLGLGLLSPEVGDRGTTTGVRAAVPNGTPWTGRPSSAFGLAVFAGVGGTRTTADGDAQGIVQVPAGIGVGYRRRIGETRALALFLTPSYTWTRRTGAEAADGLGDESNLFRTAIGGDLMMTERIGVTAGYEFGATAGNGAPGATGGIFGLGVSYIF